MNANTEIVRTEEDELGEVYAYLVYSVNRR